MSRPITVRLIGGLGNQLFGYAAGAALAGMRGTDLRLDLSHTRHGITDHGIAILDFNLPGTWLPESRAWSTPGRLPSRAAAKAIRDVPSIGRMMRVHESTVVGHDPAVLTLPAGTKLRGYFQSWKLTSTALDFGMPRRPDLNDRSAWAEGAAERALAERPIIVHVRRGDYAKVDGFGLLDRDYYSRGVERLRERGITGPVWVFSDDPVAAEHLVDGELVTGSSGAAEEMWVMSHGAGHVIANSTFGWWAAWMNDPRTPVVAPNPWFRDGPIIEGLIPPEWDRIDAAWESPSIG
jgi:hypothetical protein